jgi:peptidoglycan/LPS O-acetylase OafA/YrhL
MKMTNPEAGIASLLSVQILRAIAALSVCAVHFNALSLMLDGRQNHPLVLYPLASGVDLFFVISGFVMVYSTEHLFGTVSGPSIFLRRRLARIVPLYWTMSAIGIYANSTSFNMRSLIESYFFIPYFGPSGAMDPLYGVGWTLNFEMFFYLIFAGAIVLPRTAAVFSVCVILVVSVIIGRYIPNPPAPVKFWTDPIVLEFIFGMTLAMVYKYGLRLPRWLGLGFCIVGALVVWHAIPGQPPSGDRWAACGIPVAMIVAGLVLQPPVSRRFVLFGSLGDASYAMYLDKGMVSLAKSTCARSWDAGCYSAISRYPSLVRTSGYKIYRPGLACSAI